ncbi:helix-turn-helix domain-containing protein [Solibacillus sp. FSL W7-1464]|uniref:helix-turn-helix domain-containing protein n=1 Tax=Solibacillus sp. FSL W7-1464 TaxID=2921706 RepID=UPI0030FB55B2
MLFQQILLKILHTFKQERTISAAFHLLKGKRSGQTIHDVGLYNLHQYFGLLPKLSRNNYDEHIDILFAGNSIVIEENGYYSMTESGKEIASKPLPVSFDSWNYRGNEHLFFSRLSLVVQSLSYQLNQKKAFIPIEKNEQIQQWVRGFLIRHHYQKQQLQQLLYTEMKSSLSQLTVEDHIKDFLMYRLTGYNEPGLTWQQLAIGYEMQEIDVQLLYISGLHSWLNELFDGESRYPLLNDMVQDIRVESLLTTSASATAKLYRSGRTIEEISHIRRLKISTIEDHIVELAMNEVNFSIEPFVTTEQQRQILAAVEDYETKRLKNLKEILPHLSYFQLRLTLAKGAAT